LGQDEGGSCTASWSRRKSRQSSTANVNARYRDRQLAGWVPRVVDGAVIEDGAESAMLK
jgi:hypothetical protein